MARFKAFLVTSFLVVLDQQLIFLKEAAAATSTAGSIAQNRSSFPAGFIFGTASSAYQYEGASDQYGRKPSIWDTFTRMYPEKIKGHVNGDVADDQYHMYKGDVKLMKSLGMDAYRLSFSWSRILPYGRVDGGINQEGIAYYNNIINELVENGLEPFVTLVHWDLPQVLEKEYKGFRSIKIVEDFSEYADLCFRVFGDRVKKWITVNEPHVFSSGGYALGKLAPGRCSNFIANCSGGDSGVEPYIVAHNSLLAHAAAVKIYRQKYQGMQKGEIGLVLVTEWYMPISDSKPDHLATQRRIDFVLGWFMDPVVYGEYPICMRQLVGSRLPNFTKEESQLVKGSFDFIAINYYTTYYAYDSPSDIKLAPSYTTDSRSEVTAEKDGVAIGPVAATAWLYVYPPGIKSLLLYIMKNYMNPKIYISENGYSEYNNSTLTLEEALDDSLRISYHSAHLNYLLQAIREGVDVKGYFIWSLLDCFEWSEGYNARFGLVFVNYKDGLRRHLKKSASWFKNFLQRQQPIEEEEKSILLSTAHKYNVTNLQPL